jgi:hypothetical protein
MAMIMMTRREWLVAGGALAANIVMAASTQERAPAVANTAPRRSFKPGEAWLDTAGKPIQAHAGSILQVGDRYYWYGENKEFTTGKNDVWTWGVRCYASTDLYNWEDLGLIIPPNTDDRSSPLHPAAGLDRAVGRQRIFGGGPCLLSVRCRAGAGLSVPGLGLQLGGIGGGSFMLNQCQALDLPVGGMRHRAVMHRERRGEQVNETTVDDAF